MSHSNAKNILIGVTGSIAAYKTCTVISRLRQQGHTCRVIATPSALQFVGEATLEGLSGQRVHHNTFAPGDMMSHIDIARWADLFLIAPLTANHLNKLSLGIADDLLTTLYLAYEQNKPLFLAPAMNSVMLSHPTVVENIKKLKDRGAILLDSHAGVLACGEHGYGKMMEPEDILSAITSYLNTSRGPIHKLNVLVTYGGTREAIDGVRYISNLSTGKTGAELVRQLKMANHHVDVLRARESVPSPTADNNLYFDSHADLENTLYTCVAKKSYDLVIQMAAVSDFSVDRISGDDFDMKPSKEVKIPSSKNYAIHLKLNKKIVTQIKEHSQNKGVSVIAFKLTNTHSNDERIAAVQKLLYSNGIDAVVHNDLNEINHAANIHPFTYYKKDTPPLNLDGVSSLAQHINHLAQQVSYGSLS